MPYDDLIRSIETAAEEKKRTIRISTEREVNALLREAEAGSSAILARFQKEAEQTLELETNRQKFLTHQEVQQRIGTVRRELLDEAFSRARDILSHIRDDPSYPLLYERYIREVFMALDGEEVILHIDPADASVCREVLMQTGFTGPIIEDLTSMGGLLGISADEKIRADNTLETRLFQAKDQFLVEIMSLILGGSDG